MLPISLNQIAGLAKEIGAAGQPTHTYTQHAGTTYDTEGEAAYIPAQSLTPRPHVTKRPGRVILSSVLFPAAAMSLRAGGQGAVRPLSSHDKMSRKCGNDKGGISTRCVRYLTSSYEVSNCNFCCSAAVARLASVGGRVSQFAGVGWQRLDPNYSQIGNDQHSLACALPLTNPVHPCG
jgi:hypothetical protein